MSWFDQIRRAREAQEALGRLPPEETEELLRTSSVRSGSTQAERSYRDAMLLNADLRFRALDHDLAERVLDPAETVHDVLVGTDSTEDPPLLLVTDGRVLVTKKRAFGTWHVKDEVPAPDIVGVELEKRWLTLRVRVRARDAKDLTMKVRHNGRADEVVALLHHLLAGGTPPPPSTRTSAKGTDVTGGGSPMAGW